MVAQQMAIKKADEDEDEEESAEGAAVGRIVTFTEAIEYLGNLQLPCTFTQARDFLREVWQRNHLLSLYHHYFPQEFAHSKAAARPGPGNGNSNSNSSLPQSRSRSGSDELYSPKEIEFLQLVDERLFPIYLDYYLEGEEREDVVYIPSYGPDWWSGGWNDLHGGWQILLGLRGTFEEGQGYGPGPDLFNNIKDCHRAEIAQVWAELRGQEVDWAKLEELSRKRGEPLAQLSAAFDMLEHNTGNIFLDPTDETPAQDLEWSIDDIDFLIEQHTEASTRLDKANGLLDWLVASPTHLQEVIALWNECLQVTPIPPASLPAATAVVTAATVASKDSPTLVG